MDGQHCATAESRAPNVGVVYWSEVEGIAPLIAGLIRELGYRTVDFLSTELVPDNLDVVFAYAPFGSLVPLANQLRSQPLHRRPQFVLWLTEPLPDPSWPEWVRYPLGFSRSLIERMVYRRVGHSEWRVAPRLAPFISRGYRFRYYGDLFWLRSAGLLSVLAVTSRLTADFLRVRGFDPVVAYLGTHPDWGADLGLSRDIPVLWMGKTATRRRGQLLARIREELQARGVHTYVVDGVERPYVFGHDRTVLLNRSVIALNLLRAPYDDNSMRYYLAAHNRALIVTEPTLPHTPFEAGVHLVEAAIPVLADTICDYLAHDEKRRQIVERAHTLVTTELTMKCAIAQILARVEANWSLQQTRLSARG